MDPTFGCMSDLENLASNTSSDTLGDFTRQACKILAKYFPGYRYACFKPGQMEANNVQLDRQIFVPRANVSYRIVVASGFKLKPKHRGWDGWCFTGGSINESDGWGYSNW